MARYGFTAAAPYPISSATWWTSRTSPASTIRPTWVRVFSRTRWWWTAAVISSDGIGAFSARACRSESTMIRAPSEIAADTSSQISSSRRASAAPPPCTSYRPRETWVTKPGRSPSRLMCRILTSSSLVITGNGSTTWRHEAGVGSSRLASGPIVLESEVTSSSRIASSGGLVTCANSWLK